MASIVSVCCSWFLSSRIEGYYEVPVDFPGFQSCFVAWRSRLHLKCTNIIFHVLIIAWFAYFVVFVCSC